MSIVAYTGVSGGGGDGTSGGFTGSLSGNKVFRNSIFFRFASEGNVLEKVEFLGKEIAVGDLKQAIADAKKLERLDLQLVNEATGEVYEKDGKILPRNMTVTVRRTPQIKRKREPRVLHVEPSDCWVQQEAKGDSLASAPKVPIQRRACPQEYLCKLCGMLFEDPYISRCCGHSACARCLPGAVAGAPCPLCRGVWSADLLPVPNPRLAECVAALDLDYFILPERPQASQPSRPAASAASGGAGALPGGAAAGWPGAAAQAPLVPAAVEVRPCMLSPEQFLAWQQSVRRGASDSDSSSSSSGAKRKRKRKEKAKAKDKKRRKSGR